MVRASSLARPSGLLLYILTDLMNILRKVVISSMLMRAEFKVLASIDVDDLVVKICFLGTRTPRIFTEFKCRIPVRLMVC